MSENFQESDSEQSSSQPQEEGVLAQKQKKKQMVLWVAVLMVIILVFGAGIAILNRNNRVGSSGDGEESPQENQEVANVQTSKDFFNRKGPIKLLDLSGYTQEWNEEVLPIFSQYGNWTLSPLTKNGKQLWVLGMKNGTTRGFDNYVAVSPNFEYLAYEKRSDNKVQVILESVSNHQVVWSSPVFDDVNFYFDAATSELNVISQQDGKLSWWKNKQVVNTLDPWPYVVSQRDGAVVSEDKKRMAILAAKNGHLAIVVDGQEKVFENAKMINLIGFASDNNRLVYVVKHQNGENVAYSEDREIGRGISDGIFGLSQEPVISPDGNKMAFVESIGPDRQFVRVVGENPKVFRKDYPRIIRPSFSMDSKRLAYIVDAVDTTMPSQQKSFVVIDETEQKTYSSIGYFYWNKDGSFVYFAEDMSAEAGTLGGQGLFVVNGVEQKRWNNDVYSITPPFLAVNPMNGKVAYLVMESKILGLPPEGGLSGISSLQSSDFHQTAYIHYDNVDHKRYSEISTPYPLFTSDGRHLIYGAREEGASQDKLIIDNKEFPTQGNIWGKLYLSPDEKYVGFYSLKGQEIWWEVYEIETLLSQQ
jgi:hypothetical protein